MDEMFVFLVMEASRLAERKYITESIVCLLNAQCCRQCTVDDRAEIDRVIADMRRKYGDGNV